MMENVKLLREKYQISNSSELINKIKETSKVMKVHEEKQSQKLAEDELGIQALTSKLSSLLDELDQQTSILETKNNDLLKYKEELESLDLEVRKVVAEQQQLQLKKESLKHIKPNLKDQRIMDQGVRKFCLLKEITGIRWNFEELGKGVQGYVTNKKDYVQPFSFQLNTPAEELNKLLWKEIEKSTKSSTLLSEDSNKNQENS